MTTNRLTLATRLLIAGDAVSSLGSGLVLPLTLIYLHQVRGIALPLVGVLLAGSAALGLVAVPLAGVLIDRVGARPVLVTVLVAQGLSEAGLAWAHSVPTALPSMLLLGISMGPFFPAFTMMMAGINPDPNVQQRAFALNFTVLNAGIGAGGGIGAAVANVHHPGSFQILFLANALSCVLFAGLLTRLPNPRAHRDSAPGQRQPSQRQPQPQSGQPQPEQPKPGYRDVLAQRGLRTVMIASLMLAFTGYAALDSGLPAYATVKAHVSVHVVALAITVNTVIIVAAQLAVLRLLRVLRRSRALMAVGLIWGVAWAVFGLAALPAAAGLRVACVFAFAGLFGLGETFMAPTIAPLVNSLAAERVRGRANALSSVAYSIAFVVSPAIATGMIAGGLAVVWIGLLCLGCLGTALLGVRLGRQLTHAQDRVEPTVARAPEPTPV
ncbi:MAG TPA: MFS transporter [Streptosporangiaceae bacterium]|jgi:MFS family permease|nr:MFS transporter [Streptosporangiaceae bacterium]